MVSQTQKDNLPIAGRRWEGFALLTPNTTTDGGNGLVSYRGISGRYNQSAVDGTSNTQAFGGPVIKDKLFYFVTYEGLRKVNPIRYTSTSFNAAQTCLAAILPATCAAANAFVAAQLGAFPRATQQDVASAKVDYQFSAGNHVSASLDGLNSRRRIPTGPMPRRTTRDRARTVRR